MAKFELSLALLAASLLGCSSEDVPSESMPSSAAGAAGTAGSTQASGATAGASAARATGMSGSGDAGRAAVGGRQAAPMAGTSGSAAGSAGMEPGVAGAAGEPATSEPPGEAVWNDPGTMPWVPVPDDQVATECKLDKSMLAAQDGQFGSGWAVVRYGKLCHDASSGDTPTEAYSATKTLGALVTGIASYETRMFERTGPQTGPLLDTDLANHWLERQSYNSEALIAHVLGMVAHNDNLEYGEKTYMYDTVGNVQINSVHEMLNTAISQDAARLGGNIEEFTQKFLFDAIGMTDSRWTGEVYAYTWSATLHDMARVGTLMVHRGMWSGKRVLDESWVYKMTHPSFEDANTGYGYLTWLNARVGSTGPGGAFSGTAAATCAPPALWSKYPHPVSDAPDCNYGGESCEQEFDVGPWSAQGAGGQFILGHPGLDLVVVAKDYSGGPGGMWDAVRPALVALDPMYKGDEAAFCEVYASGRYAPDIQTPIQAPEPMPTGMTP
jgi:hypothetical protein